MAIVFIYTLVYRHQLLSQHQGRIDKPRNRYPIGSRLKSCQTRSCRTTDAAIKFCGKANVSPNSWIEFELITLVIPINATSKLERPTVFSSGTNQS
jgi:hypothetical protein